MIGLSRCALALPFALALWAGGSGCQPNAPCYSAGSIVNTANGSGALAPFTYISITGTNLSHATRARGAHDSFAIEGVHVYVDRLDALVFFVSPDLVLFLLPQDATGPRPATFQLVRQGVAGPAITLDILDCAPTLFQLDQVTAVAAHSDDWTIVTRDKPARAGELVVLYATGLGPYADPIDYPQVPTTKEDPIARRAEFEIQIDGQVVDNRLVHYAGAAPGLLSVYQINLELPTTVGRDPEVRIKLGNQISPPGVRLPVK